MASTIPNYRYLYVPNDWRKFPCKPPTAVDIDASARDGEYRPEYIVKFRHVNCRQSYRQPDDERGHSLHCHYTVAWYPSDATGSRRPSGGVTPQTLPRNCCGGGRRSNPEDGAEEPEERDLERRLAVAAQIICNKAYGVSENIDTIRAHIDWEGGPPRTHNGNGRIIHSDAVIESHLAFMRERNAGDRIQVDFFTRHNDEDVRRERMLGSLDRLSRKASSQCNKEHE